MRVLFAALLIAFPLALPASAQGPDSQQASEAPTGRISGLERNLEGGEPVIDTTATGPAASASTASTPAPSTAVLPDIVGPDILGPEGQESLQAALKAYYDYRVQGFAHRSRVFQWQLLSSRLIFALVILIVAVGLYFSWLQFRAGMKEKAGPEATSTTLEASATGIKLSSPVLGVIILALSLAFFYLYLVHVYPIEEIF
jgi:hypothetical protein